MAPGSPRLPPWSGSMLPVPTEESANGRSPIGFTRCTDHKPSRERSSNVFDTVRSPGDAAARVRPRCTSEPVNSTERSRWCGGSTPGATKEWQRASARPNTVVGSPQSWQKSCFALGDPHRQRAPGSSDVQHPLLGRTHETARLTNARPDPHSAKVTRPRLLAESRTLPTAWQQDEITERPHDMMADSHGQLVRKMV